MPNPTSKPKTAAVKPKLAATQRWRTILAALLGTLAILLILLSIVVVWLNRSLTDTTTYIGIVGPLASKPEIQNFVAQKAAEEVVKNSPTDQLANQLLPNDPTRATKTAEQLEAQLQPLVYANVQKVVASPTFADTWRTTNQTAHAALIKQLETDSDEISLNLNPLISDTVNQLQATELGNITDGTGVSIDAGKISLKNSSIQTAHDSYVNFKRATVAIVLIAVAALVAAIVVSVHHLKTARRILVTVGVAALLMAVVVEVPGLIFANATGTGTDAVTQKAVVVIMKSVFHDLQLASLVVGVLCIGAAIGTKVYEKVTAKKTAA